MIVELLIGAGLVAAGAAAARVLVRRRDAIEDELRHAKDATDDEPTDDDEGDAPRRRKARKTERAAGPRGLRVGDVILYADTELWLAGCMELDEEGFVARLFPTPGSERAEWVAQLDEVGDDLATLSPTDEVPAGSVPTALPIGGRRLELESRGSAHVRTEGEHLPRTTERASYTILSGVGGRVLVVVDFDKADRLALVGDRVAKHMIDLLPGGDLADD